MSRKPIISRTLSVETVTISAADTKINRIIALSFDIPATYPTDAARMRCIEQQLPSHIHAIRITAVSKPETQTLYMSIPDFVRHANKFESPRNSGRKENKNGTESE